MMKIGEGYYFARTKNGWIIVEVIGSELYLAGYEYPVSEDVIEIGARITLPDDNPKRT